MIGTPAALASGTVQCGSGWVSGTPGESTKAEKRDQSSSCRSPVLMPCVLARAMLSGLSSQATTVAPPACSARAVASPEPPSPNSAMVWPAKVEAGVTLRAPSFRGSRSENPEPTIERGLPTVANPATASRVGSGFRFAAPE